jgi:TolA-binding protein
MNRLGFGKASLFFLIAPFTLTAILGCASRPQAAQKLFDRGDYQLVIDKYPDLEIARRAHAKLGEKLLEQKEYDKVLRDFRDTPAAYKATQAMAQQLFDQGRYQEVIDNYPFSPVALSARDKIADSLYAQGKFDEIIQRFVETPKGKQVKEERSEKLFAEAKKLRGDKKIKALEEIVNNYSGTKIWTDANAMLAKIREAQNKKR